jgi:hypothetical protein
VIIEWRVPGDPADITPEAEMEDEDKVTRDGDDNAERLEPLRPTRRQCSAPGSQGADRPHVRPAAVSFTGGEEPA